MARLYIQTAQYDETGARTAKNVSTISATVSIVSTGVLHQTFTQGSVTNDTTGSYYIAPTGMSTGVVYNAKWVVGFTGASLIVDNRKFSCDANVAGSDIGRCKIIVRNDRIKLLVRGS